MKTQAQPLSFTLRVFIGIAAFGLTLFFLAEAASLINQLFLGIIIVLSASPLLHWLRRKRAPDWLAYTITLLAVFAVFGLLVIMMVISVERLIDSVPTYQSQLAELQSGLEAFLDDLGIAGSQIAAAIDQIQSGELIGWLISFIGGLVGVFSNIVVVAMVIIFLLVDAFSLPQKVAREVAAGNEYVERLSNFGTDIRQYVYITTIVGLVTGVFDTVLFLIMGVDFAVLWGIIAFLFSYIPTIGFWLAAIPPTLLALLESGPVAALVVFLGIVIINGFAENVVKPRSMGSGLDLSVFVVVFSVIFWSAILGPFGAILSIPMTLIVKELVLEADPQNAWMARFLGAGSGDGSLEPTEEEESSAAERY